MDCLPPDASVPATSRNQATSVAFNPVRPKELVVLLREPAKLLVYDVEAETRLMELPLSTKSVEDTGHRMFHQSTVAGVACVGCHPGGREDGQVWNFEGIGLRRTQTLEGTVPGTAPFHWSGDFSELDALMDDVFVRRMGGTEQTPERVEALQRWLVSTEPPAPLRSADDPLVVTGRELFESPDVGCAKCHGGEFYTDNRSYFVGTTEEDEVLQVPSLIGVAYRAPLMHDGCATDLWARFEPDCGGGDAHGYTSRLTLEQVEALVAYMESL